MVKISADTHRKIVTLKKMTQQEIDWWLEIYRNIVQAIQKRISTTGNV